MQIPPVAPTSPVLFITSMKWSVVVPLSVCVLTVFRHPQYHAVVRHEPTTAILDRIPFVILFEEMTTALDT